MEKVVFNGQLLAVDTGGDEVAVLPHLVWHEGHAYSPDGLAVDGFTSEEVDTHNRNLSTMLWDEGIEEGRMLVYRHVHNGAEYLGDWLGRHKVEAKPHDLGYHFRLAGREWTATRPEGEAGEVYLAIAQAPESS